MIMLTTQKKELKPSSISSNSARFLTTKARSPFSILWIFSWLIMLQTEEANNVLHD